jgi:hypothetical protein
MAPPAASDGITEVSCGKRKSKKTKSKLHCGEDAGKLSFRNMWVNGGLENYRSLVAWLKEQAARARDKALRVSNGELLLESTLWPNEAAQKTHNTASGFVTMGDVACALRHVPACISTYKHVTISAQMPATHNNATHMDACGQTGDPITNPIIKTFSLQKKQNRSLSLLNFRFA